MFRKKHSPSEYSPQRNSLDSNEFNGNNQENSTKDKIINIAQIAFVVFMMLNILFRGFYTVSEQEQALVLQFGKVVQKNSAGMYFKIPFIQEVKKVDTTVKGMTIGYNYEGNSNEENGDSYGNESESLMITSDFNFINVDFYLEYRVSDPEKFLYNSSSPEKVLRNMTQAAIRSTVSGYTVDSVMTTGKNQVQADIKEKLINELAEDNIGLEVVNLSIQDVEPPTNEIMNAFKAVETAKQEMQTATTNAEKYKNEQLPAAEAEADQIKQKAEATKAARIAEAEGQVARFNEMYAQYSLNPLITKQRLYYETMEKVLKDTKLVIDDGNTQKLYPIGSFSTVGKDGGTSEEE